MKQFAFPRATHTRTIITKTLRVVHYYYQFTITKTLGVVQRPLEEDFKPYNFPQTTYSGREKI